MLVTKYQDISYYNLSKILKVDKQLPTHITCQYFQIKFDESLKNKLQYINIPHQ